MPYVLGIGIGGIHSVAAVCRRHGSTWAEPEVAVVVPSVFHVAADGSLIAGEPSGAWPGTAVVRGFTDRIGDDVPLFVAGQTYTAQVLTALLARWVTDEVIASYGEPADHVVVTHPAGWGYYRRRLLHGALGDLGLMNCTLLPAPVATADSPAAADPMWTTGRLAVHLVDDDGSESTVVRGLRAGGFELLTTVDCRDGFGGVDAELSVDALLRTVESCGPCGVLLAGAATCLPLVAELAAARVPGPVVLAPDPATAVARGAAVAAWRLLPQDVPEVAGPPHLPDPPAGPPPRPAVTTTPIDLPERRSGRRLLPGGRR